ncbi:MAG: serine/threonine-protein kinase [Planctomycetota bacterium]
MEQIGDFEVERELGRGGMGVVYLARSPRLSEPVALKVLQPGADAQDVKRFQQEARAVARLRHPGIVRVLEHDKTRDGKWYMAMELVDGEPLDRVLARDGPLTPPRGAAMALELVKALEFAHESKVLHRDIKPANILLQRDGRVRLTDFGLAKVLGTESLTRTGDVIGTPVYMSPEQARAQRDRIDERTDIYQLGATFYHLLTGRRPFDGKGIGEVLVMIVREPPRRPSTYRPEIPDALEAIVLRCMEKDPVKRFQSAAELRAALEALVGRPSLGQRLRGWLRSCPFLGGGAATLALAALRALL